ncbi:MAG: DUF456 domain-containing protein, partial [Lachnospiraceae bacterium]|nr:DUF456 domain-containing protein [Candidatus Merdinaster equi]
GLVYGGFLVYEIVANIIAGYWFVAVAIVASLLNFVIFVFLMFRKKNHRTSAQKEMFKAFERAQKERDEAGRKMQYGWNSGSASDNSGNRASGGNSGNAKAKITRHKCAVCGRTELDGADLEFRFCSKCEGNYEYCREHLFTHTHVHK